ncbi:hypothetical protein HMPREF9538_00354 [Klebsiella sp. MS 92-3]|nr:hypothetical protein HMPREF9538_00354 [Klebsiella sp. MS 92-3]
MSASAGYFLASCDYFRISDNIARSISYFFCAAVCLPALT